MEAGAVFFIPLNFQPICHHVLSECDRNNDKMQVDVDEHRGAGRVEVNNLFILASEFCAFEWHEVSELCQN